MGARAATLKDAHLYENTEGAKTLTAAQARRRIQEA